MNTAMPKNVEGRETFRAEWHKVDESEFGVVRSTAFKIAV
jgi:hypothetical protein